MREGMSVKLPPKIERAIDEMPAISPVVNKLTEMARDMETSSVDLVKIIMLDPVLSAKVIKLVNSAFYGMATQIRSLSQAVLLLGVNTVKNLAMYTAVLDKMSFQEKKIPLDSQAFWRTACTAVASKMLARCRMFQRKNEMYSGRASTDPKFISMVPEVYGRVLTESRCLGVPLYFAEMSHFDFPIPIWGCWPESGNFIRCWWKQSNSIIGGCGSHGKPCGQTVVIATICAKGAGLGDPIFEDVLTI